MTPSSLAASSDSDFLERPHWLPAEGTLHVLAQDRNSLCGEARVGGHSVATLVWDPEGTLTYEAPLNDRGRRHGIAVSSSSGRAEYCCTFDDGVAHGPAIQFGPEGEVLSVTRYEQGNGVDVWLTCGRVSEVRQKSNDRPHGFVRWGDPAKPHEEDWFFEGRRHGVRRRWNERGELAPGYPQFYVHGKQTALADYAQECASDGSLRPYDARENERDRAVPPEVQQALGTTQQLNAHLGLLDRARARNAARDTTRQPVNTVRAPLVHVAEAPLDEAVGVPLGTSVRTRSTGWFSDYRVELQLRNVESPISFDQEVCPIATSTEGAFELAAFAWCTNEGRLVWAQSRRDDTSSEPSETWVRLGYDVCDEYGTSALSNTGFGSSHPLVVEEWSGLLNEDHLLADLASADRFRRVADRLVPEQAPFTAIELWIRRSEALDE